MLDLAAANAKYELSESEIEFWKRQMVGYPDALIEQFFSEHIAQSKWMPQFHDWHEWVEARNEQARYENKAYWEEYRRKQETVQAWRESPQYETEMAEIKRKLESIVAKAKPVGTVSAGRPEIPLAMSPEKEREYLASFKKEGA